MLKEHKKMYKSGKNWAVATMAAVTLGGVAFGQLNAHADVNNGKIQMNQSSANDLKIANEAVSSAKDKVNSAQSSFNANSSVVASASAAIEQAQSIYNQKQDVANKAQAAYNQAVADGNNVTADDIKATEQTVKEDSANIGKAKDNVNSQVAALTSANAVVDAKKSAASEANDTLDQAKAATDTASQAYNEAKAKADGIKDDLNNIDNVIPTINFTDEQKALTQKLVKEWSDYVNQNLEQGENTTDISKLPSFNAWADAMSNLSYMQSRVSVHKSQADRQELFNVINPQRDQVEKLSEWTAAFLNKIDKALGIDQYVGENVATVGLADMAQEVAQIVAENNMSEYGHNLYALNKAAYDHGITESKKYLTDKYKFSSAGSNGLGESLGTKGNCPGDPYDSYTLADAKQWVFDTVVGMLFNDKGSDMGHTTALLGINSIMENVNGDQKGQVIGVSISGNKQPSAWKYYASHILTFGKGTVDSSTLRYDPLIEEGVLLSEAADQKLVDTKVNVPLENSYEDLAATKKKLQKDLAAANEKVSAAKRNLDKANNAQQNVQQKADQAQKEFNQAKSNSENAQKELNAAKEALTAAQNKLEQAQQKLSAQTKNLEKINAEKKVLDQANTDLDTAKSNLNQAQQKFDELVKTQSKLKDRVNKEKAGLKQAQTHLNAVKAVVRAQDQNEANSNGYHINRDKVVDKNNQPVSGWLINASQPQMLFSPNGFFIIPSAADSTTSSSASSSADSAVTSNASSNADSAAASSATSAADSAVTSNASSNANSAATSSATSAADSAVTSNASSNANSAATSSATSAADSATTSNTPSNVDSAATSSATSAADSAVTSNTPSSAANATTSSATSAADSATTSNTPSNVDSAATSSADSAVDTATSSSAASDADSAVAPSNTAKVNVAAMPSTNNEKNVVVNSTNQPVELKANGVLAPKAVINTGVNMSKDAQTRLPQTGNHSSMVAVLLGAMTAMFGLGLGLKKRY